MKPLIIIGTGTSIDDITLKQHKIIENADFLIGGHRLLEMFEKLKIKKLVIKNNLTQVVEEISQCIDHMNIVVLASGDPMFFGIGAFLTRKFGKDSVKIMPNISSVARAFSKIKEQWNDAHLLSLHGKRSNDISPIFSGGNKFAILTDKKKDPSWLAKKIVGKNQEGFSMCILENIDSPKEKISWFDDMRKVINKKFESPNIVILKRENPSRDFTKNQHVHPGMKDHAFSTDKGLITKSEIRSIVLSKLNFTKNNHLFWDLGAGSGAISIEASSIVSHETIYAVEKNEKRIPLIKENISRFNIPNIKLIHGTLPGILDKLPVPDRIFIGGGGKDLLKICKEAVKRLALNGIIVVNTILIENPGPVFQTMKKSGLGPELLSVQISKSKSMPHGERLEPLNPVWIIYGKKESQIG